MSIVQTVGCSEIWGGNRDDEIFVETSGIRACLYSKACDGGKGGDIYYFSVCGSDLLTRIAIMDVMGHGKAVTDISQWLYNSLAARMNSANGNDVLSDLNKASIEKVYEAMSTATIAAFYSENGTLFFSYAGHHEILLNRKNESSWCSLKDNASENLAGLPLGVEQECQFSQQDVCATVGDRIFLYTDGLIEAMDEKGNQFTTERLLNVLEQNSDFDLSQIRQSVLDSLVQHSGGNLNHDDITFMIVEIIKANSD